MRPAFETGEYPYTDRMSRRRCEWPKAQLQAEPLKVQHRVQETGQEVVLIPEGRDAGAWAARATASCST